MSEPNYCTTKCFSESLLAIEMKRMKVKMNKPGYLGWPILDISKTLMYEFWHDYIKLNAKYKIMLYGYWSSLVLKLKMFMKAL